MKKSMIIITTILCLSITACGGSTATASPTNVESNAVESTINMTVGDGTIVYEKYELTDGPDGEKGIRVYYTYTHKSNESGYPDSTFDVKAYQKDEELKWVYTWDRNDSEKNMEKEIKKGESIEVAKQYELLDTTSSVILHVNEFANYKNKDYQEMVIDITQGV